MNILLITSDQQRADTIGAYGSKVPATPNIDLLAKQGAVFESAYCQHPYCQPSRWTILTGQHPRTHGIWGNGVDPTPKQVEDAFSTRVAEQGYRRAFIGKAHFATNGVFLPGRSSYMEAIANSIRMPEDWRGPYMGFDWVELIQLGHFPFGYGPAPLGLHYGKWLGKDGYRKALERFQLAAPWRALEPKRGAPQTWNSALPEEFHSTTWVADRTIDWIKGNKGSPFFLWASFPDPHHPLDPPAPWCFKFDPRDMPLPKRDPKELDSKPPIQRKMSKGIGGPAAALNPSGGKISDQALSVMTAAYYGMVAQIDHHVGRILASLDELGISNDTLVIYTTDHGEMMGDHSLLFKGPFHYDGVLRVPLILRGPQVPKGKRISDVVGTIDLVPTFEELTKAKRNGTLVQGESLLPLFKGKARRERVFTENDHTILFKTHLLTMVTPRHKINRHVGKPFGEIYDRVEDPGEFHNLWDENPALRRELEAEMDEHLPPPVLPKRRVTGPFPA
ncbi:MAG: sulfatase-like hydrolase/transferase [Bdellovibrionota bacterium]